MKWKDLKLDKMSLEILRKQFEIEKPEEVIKLAWGAPDLLCRVIPAEEVSRLREQFSSPDADSFDSSKFAMGAWFGSPGKSPLDRVDQFEELRSKLLEEIEHTQSPRKRSALEGQLLKLYER